MLSLPREMRKVNLPQVYLGSSNHEGDHTCATHPRLKNLFLKHVKLKKRHEISVMADVVTQVALKSNCKAVVDFGSGLGHLVRVLTYKNNIYTAGIECQNQLTEEARSVLLVCTDSAVISIQILLSIYLQYSMPLTPVKVGCSFFCFLLDTTNRNKENLLTC